MNNTDRIVTHEPPCAASAWNYDMDAAPRDGTRILLAWRHEDVVHIDVFCYGEDEQSEYVWWSGSEFLDAVEPFAWANLNVPEVPK